MLRKLTNKKWSNGFFIGFFLMGTLGFLKEGNALMSALDLTILILNVIGFITMEE